MGENGNTLGILLAQNFGALEYKPSNGDAPYLEAVAPSSPRLEVAGHTNPYAAAAKEDAERAVVSPRFLVGGTPTPVPTPYILPYDLVKATALHFLQTGERKPDIVWEKI